MTTTKTDIEVALILKAAADRRQALETLTKPRGSAMAISWAVTFLSILLSAYACSELDATPLHSARFLKAAITFSFVGLTAMIFESWQMKKRLDALIQLTLIHENEKNEKRLLAPAHKSANIVI